ncbi:potassium channel family protein [Marinobacter lacisalsi]|uniref:Potassium channel family protein n=1 Tax=Marinobacter lacisalsi TaxID=475979 RepID=A0ABV8QJ35_9GAMM
MIEKQQILVIGLGVFGATIARELSRLGHEVLGIDVDEQRVDRLADEITHAIIADVTDETALRELNAGSYDVGVVAIGRHVEATILATMQLKELGVEKVWAKALTNQHHRILERLGADRIIGPEYEMGIRVAQELNYPMVHDYLSLGDNEFVVELHTTEELINKSLDALIEESDVTTLMVRRNRDSIVMPNRSFTIQEGDKLILSGQLSALQGLVRHL